MTDMKDFNKAVIEEFRANHGKVGGGFEGMPMVLLSTTGAKSGLRRTNPLAALVDGDHLYVIASKAGAPTHPDWYHNVLATPEVEVEFGDEKFGPGRAGGPARSGTASTPYRWSAARVRGLREVDRPGHSRRRARSQRLSPTRRWPRRPFPHAGAAGTGGRVRVLGIHRLGRRRRRVLPGGSWPRAAGRPPSPSWVGRGAAALGLDGARVEAGLPLLLAGRHPPGGPARLGPDHGGGLRPDIQRAQVGQRALRPRAAGRRRRGGGGAH